MENNVWIESKAQAESNRESAKEMIFASCYEKNMKKLDIAIKAYHESNRAVTGWENWIESSAEDRYKLAIEKARSQAAKQAKKAGREMSDYMQFAEDAAQDAIIFICYELTETTNRAPESILSYIAAKKINQYVYFSGDRNGREENIDAQENIDAFLYSKNVFGPGPEKAVLMEDAQEEIISELKEKYQDQSRIIIAALKAGYNQEEIASRLGVNQSTISRRIDSIKAAAATARKAQEESNRIERQIESDENTLYNMQFYFRK